jgi:hypothetical protein
VTSSQRYLLLTLLCLSSPARELPADSFPLEERNVLYKSGLRSCSTSLSHVEGKGVGCDTGYSTVGLFASRPRCPTPWIPFIDLQGHIFNNGLYATNVGVGLRYTRSAMVWGGGCYYDYRHADATNYHQLGLSLEVLGAYWGLYVNGYFPLAAARSVPCDRSLQSRGSPSGVSYFQGHHLFLQLATPTLFRSKQEVALTGMDATLLMRAYENGFFSLDCGAGPYYYAPAAKTPAAAGGRATVHLGFTEYVTCHISTTYDTLFHQRAQVELRFSIPFGKRPCSASKRSSCAQAPSFYAARLMQGSYRNNIIALHTRTLTDALYTEAALSPVTGEPYQFYFVNNQSHSQGTFESPFPRLEQALLATEAGEIIYVYPGDGSPYETTLTLRDHQQLLGSGHDHSLHTHRGAVLIPAQTQTMPSLRSSGSAPLVTLASHNTVSGFHLEGVHPGNVVRAVGCKDIVFTRNDSHSPHSIETTALSLENCSGLLHIQNNQFTAHAVGLSVLGKGSSDTTLAIAHNIFSQCGSCAALLNAQDTSSVHLTFHANTLSESKIGLSLHVSDGATLFGSVTENKGHSVAALVGRSVQQSTCALKVVGNAFSESDGILWTGADRSVIDLAIQNNHFLQHLQYGISLNVSDKAQLTTVVTGNTCSTSAQQTEGLYILTNTEATVTHRHHINNNTFLGHTQAGIHLALQGNSPMDLAIADNVIDSNAQENGIKVELHEQSHLLHAAIVRNTWKSSSLFYPEQMPLHPRGLALEFNGTAQASTLVLTHNVFSFPMTYGYSPKGCDGIHLTLCNEAHVSHLSCSHNAISFPASDSVQQAPIQGIEIAAQHKSVLKQALITDNHIQFAPFNAALPTPRSHGIEIATSEDAQMGKDPVSLCIQNNTITGIVERGIFTCAESSQRFCATISNNTLSFSPLGKEAIGIFALSKGGTSQMHIDGNRIDGSHAGWFGIYVGNKSASLQTGILKNNTVVSVNSPKPIYGGGIGVDTEGRADLNILIHNNALSDNLPQGVVGLGPTSLEGEGRLHLNLQGNHASDALLPDGYTLWNQPTTAPSRVTYQDAGGNRGPMNWLPDKSHFTELRSNP